jgi:glycosyltransferase involved in cell wall biosynthesis
MPGNISKGNFLVISDTAIYRDGNTFYAYEPVVRELDSIAPLFKKIIWLGSRVDSKANNLVRVSNSKIKCVQLPSVRHKRLNIFYVLAAYVPFLFYIIKYIVSATYVHTRGPSHPALIGIVFSFIDKRRKFWHKYGGNWVATDLPRTYRLQRKLLKRLRSKNNSITVNGKWLNTNNRIYAFENPCMHEKERLIARNIATSKVFSSSLSLVFVGDLTQKKGILELMECIEQKNIPSIFSELFIVGDGALYDELKKRASKIDYPKIKMTGRLNRSELDAIYSQCHILILPSYAEGFPKVIAEGAAFGCVPIVTDISSISQYIIDGESGFLMENSTPHAIKEALEKISTNNNLKQISDNITVICEKFTYEYFKQRIEHEIFSLPEIFSA